MKKCLGFLVIFIFFNILTAFSNDSIPKIFKLNWGDSLKNVKNQFKKNNPGFSDIEYYPIYENRNEYVDLKSLSALKYSTKGVVFFDIPGEVIFTFYNPINDLNYLKLSKIEVILEKKDKAGLWVDVKDIYKKLVMIFWENYNIQLNYNKEYQILNKDYDYQVTVNGVYVNFTGNTGKSILGKNDSIYISYESNMYQNMILRKKIDEEYNDSDKKIDRDNDDVDAKDNL